MRKKYIMTAALFMVLVSLGLKVASQRPLWNDEYYSLVANIHNISYVHILEGYIGEGNNSPLFYVLQKLQCDLFSYHPPQRWLDGHWGGEHAFDQIFLRIQPVVFMSAALCALFYYFVLRNSWGWGIYAMAVAMTSSLFWSHWTEARPYALWFSLSQFQILLLLDLLEKNNGQINKNWVYLTVVHWLLALTTFFSVVQILAAGTVLWIFQRRGTWWLVPMVLVPLGTCGFYYVHAPHYNFYFVNGPLALINANIPKDRLFMIFMIAIIFIIQRRGQDWKSHLEIKYLAFLLLMLGAFGLMLLKLKYGQTQGPGSFQISSRYFLSLVPAGIMGVVLFSEYFLRAFPSRTWKLAAMAILICFFVFRLEKITQQVPQNQLLSFHLTPHGL